MLDWSEADMHQHYVCDDGVMWSEPDIDIT